MRVKGMSIERAGQHQAVFNNGELMGRGGSVARLSANNLNGAQIDGLMRSLNGKARATQQQQQQIQQTIAQLQQQQAAQPAGNCSPVYSLIRQGGVTTVVTLKTDGTLLLQNVAARFGRSGRGDMSGNLARRLNPEIKQAIVEAEAFKLRQQQAARPDGEPNQPQYTRVRIGNTELLVGLTADNQVVEGELGMNGKTGRLSNELKQVVVDVEMQRLRDQQAAGANGTLYGEVNLPGMHKLLAVRADGRAEAIDFSAYKAKSMREARRVDQTVVEMRAWQAANPGQAIKRTIKVGKVKFEIRLDADGNMSVKRIKPKGFFSKLLGGITKIFSKILPVLSIVSMFVPFAAPFAIALKVVNAVSGVVNAIKSKNILGGIASIAGAFTGNLASSIQKGLAAAQTVYSAAKNGVKSVLGGIGTAVGFVGNLVTGTAQKILGYVERGANISENIKNKDYFGAALGLAGAVGGEVKSARLSENAKRFATGGQMSRAALDELREANRLSDKQVNDYLAKTKGQEPLLVSLDKPLVTLPEAAKAVQTNTGTVSDGLAKTMPHLTPSQQAVVKLMEENARRRGMNEAETKAYFEQGLRLAQETVSKTPTELALEAAARRGLTAEQTVEYLKQGEQLAADLKSKTPLQLAFEAAQRRGMTPEQTIDYIKQGERLAQDTKNLLANNVGVNNSLVEETTKINTNITTPLGTATSSISPGLYASGPGLYASAIIPNPENVSTDYIRGLQKSLQSFGFYNGPIDGDFGEGTQNALKQFQAAANRAGITVDKAPLEVDGVLGKKTIAVINNQEIVNGIGEFLGKEKQNTIQLQQALKKAGFDPGSIDGVYGDSTKKAVLEFQLALNKAGWQPSSGRPYDEDGIAGKDTIAALNSAKVLQDLSERRAIPAQTNAVGQSGGNLTGITYNEIGIKPNTSPQDIQNYLKVTPSQAQNLSDQIDKLHQTMQPGDTRQVNISGVTVTVQKDKDNAVVISSSKDGNPVVVRGSILTINSPNGGMRSFVIENAAKVDNPRLEQAKPLNPVQQFIKNADEFFGVSKNTSDAVRYLEARRDDLFKNLTFLDKSVSDDINKTFKEGRDYAAANQNSSNLFENGVANLRLGFDKVGGALNDLTTNAENYYKEQGNPVGGFLAGAGRSVLNPLIIFDPKTVPAETAKQMAMDLMMNEAGGVLLHQVGKGAAPLLKAAGETSLGQKLTQQLGRLPENLTPAGLQQAEDNIRKQLARVNNFGGNPFDNPSTRLISTPETVNKPGASTQMTSVDKAVANNLPERGSFVVVPKEAAGADATARLAREFGEDVTVLSRGNERLVVRGKVEDVLDRTQRQQLAEAGWSRTYTAGVQNNQVTVVGNGFKLNYGNDSELPTPKLTNPPSRPNGSNVVANNPNGGIYSIFDNPEFTVATDPKLLRNSDGTPIVPLSSATPGAFGNNINPGSPRFTDLNLDPRNFRFSDVTIPSFGTELPNTLRYLRDPNPILVNGRAVNVKEVNPITGQVTLADAAPPELFAARVGRPGDGNELFRMNDFQVRLNGETYRVANQTEINNFNQRLTNAQLSQKVDPSNQLLLIKNDGTSIRVAVNDVMSGQTPATFLTNGNEFRLTKYYGDTNYFRLENTRKFENTSLPISTVLNDNNGSFQAYVRNLELEGPLNISLRNVNDPTSLIARTADGRTFNITAGDVLDSTQSRLSSAGFSDIPSNPGKTAYLDRMLQDKEQGALVPRYPLGPPANLERIEANPINSIPPANILASDSNALLVEASRVLNESNGGPAILRNIAAFPTDPSRGATPAMTQFLKSLENYAKNKGSVTLDVWSTSPEAVKYFESIGVNVVIQPSIAGSPVVNHMKSVSTPDRALVSTGAYNSLIPGVKNDVAVQLPNNVAETYNRYHQLIAQPATPENIVLRKQYTTELFNKGVAINDPYVAPLASIGMKNVIDAPVRGGNLQVIVGDVTYPEMAQRIAQRAVNDGVKVDIITRKIDDNSRRAMLEQIPQNAVIRIPSSDRNGSGQVIPKPNEEEFKRLLAQNGPGLQVDMPNGGTLNIVTTNQGGYFHSNYVRATNKVGEEVSIVSSGYLWPNQFSNFQPDGTGYEGGVMLTGKSATELRDQYVRGMTENVPLQAKDVIQPVHMQAVIQRVSIPASPNQQPISVELSNDLLKEAGLQEILRQIPNNAVFQMSGSVGQAPRDIPRPTSPSELDRLIKQVPNGVQIAIPNAGTLKLVNTTGDDTAYLLDSQGRAISAPRYPQRAVELIQR